MLFFIRVFDGRETKEVGVVFSIGESSPFALLFVQENKKYFGAGGNSLGFFRK